MVGRPVTPTSTFQATFGAGELAPSLWWRNDLAPWKAGAALLRNFIVSARGGAVSRPGTQYVATARDASATQRLVAWRRSATEQVVLEFGDGYLRFHANGAPILAGGTPYEISTPYGAAELRGLRMTQSADVMTIVHPNHPPHNLTRTAFAVWSLGPVNSSARIAAPAATLFQAHEGSFGTATKPAQLGYVYAVTAASTDTKAESVLSPAAQGINYALDYYSANGVYNTIGWQGVPGATHYNIYRAWRGVWGYVGSVPATATSFDDINYVPDTGTSPPQFRNPFGGSDFPAAVAYYQERRFFAGSPAQPSTIWASKSGGYDNFDVSDPVRADDAITYTLVGREVNGIRHLVPLQDLIVLTGDGGWRISGGQGAIAPGNFQAIPQAFVGSSEIEPVLVGNLILFVEAAKGSVHEIGYQQQAGGYLTTEKSTLASHLFDARQVVAMAWARAPHHVLWLVLDNGAALSLTYLPEQQVCAFARHDTEGSFLDVCVVRETVDGVTEDVPYFLVQRTLQGAAKTTVERLYTRVMGRDNADIRYAWAVDCGLRYAGPRVSSVQGLGHLAGKDVVGVSDGRPFSATVGADGTVALPTPGQVVTVGLAFSATLRTLPLNPPEVSPMHGNRKRVSKVRVVAEKSYGMTAGAVDSPDRLPLGGLAGADDPASGAFTPPALLTGVQETVLPGFWDREAQVEIVQALPLPATVLGVVLDFEAGVV